MSQEHETLSEIEAAPDSLLASPLGRDKPAGPDAFESEQHKQNIAKLLFGRPAVEQKIDRYTVLRKLGAGAMGTVYLAYDTRLDRRVAVKLLHQHQSKPRAKQRMHREAQAMAKLSHPNVVAVYEVGSVEDEQLFVAMEYVKGQDLRAWLMGEERGVEEILQVFIAAGEGLAAAHDAGVIHRDFKPDNVLVGDDGRVRVADFGLAHARRDLTTNSQTGPIETETETRAGAAGGFTAALTRTGSVMGTPAYMAIEQHTGGLSDARSDQFGFCAALWEGLHDQLPFHGDDRVSLALAVARGRITPAPRERVEQVPPWLRAVVRRGLSAKPEQRWPDMRTLLAALADDPLRRRRQRARVATLTLTILTLILGLSWLTTTSLRHDARQRYWNSLTEELLDIERERGLGQATDDAERARDATKMSVYRSYRERIGVIERQDPTVAAVLLREVGAAGRASDAWRSAANASLGRPLSYALLDDHRDAIRALAFSPIEPALYSGAADGEVRGWSLETGGGELLLRHEGRVSAVVVSPDGLRLASAAMDGTVWLISTDGSAEPELAVRGESGVTSLAFDPRGRLLASTWSDGQVRLHELDEARAGPGRLLAQFDGAAHSVSFDSVGAQVLASSTDKTARVWTIDGQELATLRGHSKPLFHARFATDDWVLTGADDGTVRGWWLGEPTRAREPAFIIEHGSAITALAVHRRQLALASLDGRVHVSSIDTPEQGFAVEGHTRGVWALAFTPDGEQLVTASFDNTIRVSPVDGRGPARVLRGHRAPLLSAVIDPAGRYLATGGFDTDVRVWDLERPVLEVPLLAHRDRIQSVMVDKDGARVVTASSDQTARIWDARDGAQLAVRDGGHPLNAAVFSPNGELVALGRNDGKILLWTPASDAVELLEGHQLGVRGLAFSPSGDRLLSVSSDHSARLWSPDQAAALALLRAHEGVVFKGGFDRTGARILTVSADGTLRSWDGYTGAPEHVFEGHRGPILDFASSPDGRLLATASDDHSVRIWLANDPRDPLVLSAHDKRVKSVAFDQLGARLLTASDDGTARIWSVDEGSVLTTLSGHRGELEGARFIDAEHVVTYATDNSLRVWALEGDESEPASIELLGHDQPVLALAISPTADWIVSASVDRSARIWRIDQLDFDPGRLAERLGAATLACLPVNQRQRELSESSDEAKAALAACEAAHRR